MRKEGKVKEKDKIYISRQRDREGQKDGEQRDIERRWDRRQNIGEKRNALIDQDVKIRQRDRDIEIGREDRIQERGQSREKKQAD